MDSLHRLIVSILAWVTSGGVLVVLYASLFLNMVPIWAVILLTMLLIGGALCTTWLATRQAAGYQS